MMQYLHRPARSGPRGPTTLQRPSSKPEEDPDPLAMLQLRRNLPLGARRCWTCRGTLWAGNHPPGRQAKSRLLRPEGSFTAQSLAASSLNVLP